MRPNSAPSASALPAVPSVLPSSTTRMVASGSASRRRPTSISMFSASLYVGTVTQTRMPLFLAGTRPGAARDREQPGRAFGDLVGDEEVVFADAGSDAGPFAAEHAIDDREQVL